MDKDTQSNRDKTLVEKLESEFVPDAEGADHTYNAAVRNCIRVVKAHESEARRELVESHQLGIAIGILKNSKKFCINDEMQRDYARRIKEFDEEYKRILAKHGKGTA